MSQSHLDKIPSAVFTNFSYAKSDAKDFLNPQKRFDGCFFDGIDFSGHKLELSDFSQIFYTCSFQNTKLQISYLPTKSSKEEGKLLGTDIKNGRLIGCYVNGVLIKTKEEQDEIKKEKREDFQDYKEYLYDKIMESIEESVKEETSETKKEKVIGTHPDS